MQIIVWLENSLKSTMVSSLEVRNRVIDTISEIKAKISNWEASRFETQSNVHVINVGMVMR